MYELAIFTRNVVKDTKAKKEEADRKGKEQTALGARQWVPELETELLRRIMILSLDWPGSLSCRKTSELDEVELQLKDFSCRTADCFKPADRATILAAIRDEWGSENEFDTFVRTELVRILENSKKAYKTKMVRTAYRSFELAFGG